MIPFSPPYINEEIIDEVTKTLKSGWITTGPKVEEFEMALANYAGIKKVVCVNAATSGLELVLRWFGVKEGDEVIIPAYTYCATANVVLHCGAKPVMVDVKDDFNINPALIENVITSKTKAIIPVDIGGLPCDYNEILDIIKKKEIVDQFNPTSSAQSKLGRILVLADAAHSFGAFYHGKLSGAIADLSVFSFHAVKNLTTSEGGAICINLPDPFDVEILYNHFRVISIHGQDKDAMKKTMGNSWEYDVIDAGYKFNMTDICASIGLIGLKQYDSKLLKRRKAIFEMYDQLLSKYKWAEIPVVKDSNRNAAYHAFLLKIRGISEEQRNWIIKEIFANGVSVNVHFKPLPLLTVYMKLGYKIDDFPVAYDNFSREISLPVYYGLTNKQIYEVVAVVAKAVNQVIC